MNYSLLFGAAAAALHIFFLNTTEKSNTVSAVAFELNPVFSTDI